MSLGDHLDELRRRIIFSLCGLGVGTVICLLFGKEIVSFLCVPLVMVLSRLGLSAQTHSFTILSAFNVYLKVSLLGGVILTMPWVLWQFWKFIEPGLYPHERKFVYMLVPGSTLLTITGVAFMYYIMLPVMLAFLLQFAVSFPPPSLEAEGFFNSYLNRLMGAVPAQVDPVESGPPPVFPVLKNDPLNPVDGMIWIKIPEYQLRVMVQGEVRSMALVEPTLNAPLLQIDQYVSSVIWLALAFALTFQLPIVMLMLGVSRIVGAVEMARIRKYALLGCCIVGALLTPADPLSMILLAGPMYLLYEVGILLCRLFVKPYVMEEDDFDELPR